VSADEAAGARTRQFCSAAPFLISPDDCVQIQADLAPFRPLDTTAHADVSTIIRYVRMSR
jgi:hypothetical protein